MFLSIGRITFLTFQEKEYLQNNLDSAYTLALFSIDDIEERIQRKLNRRCIWNGKENLRMAQISMHLCKEMGVRILFHFQKEFPELLRQISDPPYVLFCRGNLSLLQQENISVVGTRKISPSGKNAALTFSYDAAMDGKNIVSGLAFGADSYAHRGALNAFYDAKEKNVDLSMVGKNIAVLPGSIDEIVPYQNKKLASQIIESGGLLISEYEPGMPIAKWHFVGRNRLIAGLSMATVVIEAPNGSGSLITADFALEYNRDVMFHQTCFSDNAKIISGFVKNQLDKDFACGKVSKYKLENSPEKYLESGAPVIKDYKDFCEALVQSPGMQKSLLQGELFE